MILTQVLKHKIYVKIKHFSKLEIQQNNILPMIWYSLNSSIY